MSRHPVEAALFILCNDEFPKYYSYIYKFINTLFRFSFYIRQNILSSIFKYCSLYCQTKRKKAKVRHTQSKFYLLKSNEKKVDPYLKCIVEFKNQQRLFKLITQDIHISMIYYIDKVTFYIVYIAEKLSPVVSFREIYFWIENQSFLVRKTIHKIFLNT